MQIASNRLADVVAWYRKFIRKQYDAEEAGTVVDWVIENMTGFSRLKVMANPDYRLSESEILKIHFAFKRIAANEPVQYVLKEAWFYGRQFEATPDVLIPRRETEELVEWGLRLAGEGWRVLDVGTGSGCIALTMKLEKPSLQVTALDFDAGALEVCRRNAVRLNAEAELVQADALNLSDDNFIQPFQMIVSNPPYVRLSEKVLMKPNVLNYEPHQALFVTDEDPLIFYRAVGEFARKKLAGGGLILFEINEALGDEMVELLRSLGFGKIELRRDMQQRWRMVKGVNDEG